MARDYIVQETLIQSWLPSADADSGPDWLVLADLTGKVLKRLDRYGKRRRPEGEIALTDQWAAWKVKRATYDEPAGPGNVFLKRL